MEAEDYLALSYAIELVQDKDEVGRRGWVAEIEELPGCISHGATPEEATANVRDARNAANVRSCAWTRA